MIGLAVTAGETRMQWWHEARFGLFIHWGVYAIPARGEWVMHVERIPKEDYRPLADQFNPTKYKPREWVALAKEAGQRYMVLTSRHHDGFSLFDSQVSDFTAPKTAAKRDLVGEYVEACHKAKMRVGFYYSLLDWRYDAYWAGPEKEPQAWADLVGYVHEQVRELCSSYGKIDILWYDGGWPWTAEQWRSAELNAMARRLQPDIIINNRSGLPEDHDTPEQHVTASDAGRPWESCMTINDNWGYSSGDRNFKSVRQLVYNLVRCASGGGNYLLNVGPRADGTIPASSASRLRRMGEWLRENGESIYGAGQAPFGGGMVGLTSAKGSKVYLHVLRWPGDEMCLAGVEPKVKRAKMLASGDKLKVEQIAQGQRLFLRGLPRKARDPLNSVITMEVER